MNILTSMKNCFRKYFDFSGRASRTEFWNWVSFTVIIGLLLKLLDNLIFGSPLMSGPDPMFSIFCWLMLIPCLSVGYRRLHDTGRSGWWIGSGFLLLIFMIIFAIVMALLVPLALGPQSIIRDTYRAIVSAAPSVAKVTKLLWIAIILGLCCLETQTGENKYGKSLKS